MLTKETGGCHHKGGKICVILLLIINLVLASFAFYYSYQNYSLEVIRGGGQKNFDAMNKFYASEAFVNYVTEAQAQQLADFESLQPTGNDVLPTPSDSQVLDQATLTSLKSTGKIKGDINADITILEFADVNCVYCKRQIAETKTVQTLMSAYPNVNVIYKNMPVLGSVTEAQIIECFGAEKSVEEYYNFVEAVYANNAGVENLYTIAAGMGADADAIRTCVNEGTSKNVVDTQMEEGRTFNISGTPASVIINNNNGLYTLVEGAQPIASFESAVNSLLNS
ncbi:MAG: DsbA family protein [Candidatus Peribacteria bacterium]|jgi:protein-disulfide isomerase|nr:DsbA family protein [Candidatus Peribacteria bacterium]